MKKPKRPLADGIKNFFKMTVIVFANIVRLPFFIVYWTGWCFIAFCDFIAAFLKYKFSKIKRRREREQRFKDTKEKIIGGTE